MKVIIKYLRIILPHLGIALIVLAMGLGYFYNWRGKAVLLMTDKTNVFITKNEVIHITPFALTLTLLNVTSYDSGEPKSLKAVIDVEENNQFHSISLSVNQPCKMGFGKDLYLVNYDRDNLEYCIVELVYEPFQGVFLAGIILVCAGLFCTLSMRNYR